MYVAGVPVTPAVTLPLTQPKRESYGGRDIELYNHRWESNSCDGGLCDEAGGSITPAETYSLTHSKEESYGGRVTELYRHS